MDKPVVWRDKWLKTRFINCKQQIDNKLWFIDFNAYGYQVSFTEEVNGVDIGDYKRLEQIKIHEVCPLKGISTIIDSLVATGSVLLRISNNSKRNFLPLPNSP